MLSEQLHNLLNRLDIIRRQVELLESHKVTGMITIDQYEETGKRLEMQVEAIEKELDYRPKVEARSVIYDKTKPTEAMNLENEIFNSNVHRAIDDVIES